MFTWKRIYNLKYSNETLLCVPYACALKSLISVITHMSLPLTLIANDILKILDNELKKKGLETSQQSYRKLNLI